MLRIPWTQKRTNSSVLSEIGTSNRLLDIITMQILRYFGHISRRKGDNLEKVIMQGMVEGTRKRGRPRSRWIDQIKAATGHPLHVCYTLADDRLLWHRISEVTSC